MSSNYSAQMRPNIGFEVTPTRPQIPQVESLHYFVRTSGGQVEPDKEYDEDDIIVYDPYGDEVKFGNSDNNSIHWKSTLDVADNNNLINNNSTTSALQVNHPGSHFVEGVIGEDRDMFQCLHLLVDTAVAVASNVANNNINSSNNNSNEVTKNYNNNNLNDNIIATSALQVNHAGNNFVEGVVRDDIDMFQCLHLLVDTAVAVRQREKEQQEKEEKRNDENVLVLRN